MRAITRVMLPCVLALAALAPSARAEELKRVAERLVPFDPGGSVHIDDKNGRIVVEAWPRSEVRIQITRVVRADDRAKAEALMKDLEAQVEVRKNRIDIESAFPKRYDGSGFMDLLRKKNESVQIHYYVQVPLETDLVIETSNGEVSAQGTKGRLEANTKNGDVRISRVKGSVKLATTNGEVRITDVSGQASAQTTNGSIVAQIRDVPAQGSVILRTMNGNVEAYFDKDLKAELDAETTNGQVSVAFPLERDGVSTPRSIRGIIQGGGAKITIQTTNGNVEVRRIGEGRP